jgi:hypothetical protein
MTSVCSTRVVSRSHGQLDHTLCVQQFLEIVQIFIDNFLNNIQVMAKCRTEIILFRFQRSIVGRSGHRGE